MSVIREILLVLLGLFAAMVVFVLVGMPSFNKKPTEFFKSAEKDLPLVEVLDRHPGWYRISFGEQLEKDGPMAMGGRSDCGAIYKTAEGLKLSPPLAAQTQKNTSTLRDLFQSVPQLFPQVFAKCHWAYVTYNTFMFQRGTVDVQVDTQGKIVLAKEPRYWD